VITEKLLTVHKHLVHRLPLRRDLAILIYLDTGKLLKKVLYLGVGLYRKTSGIVLGSITPDGDRLASAYQHLFQQLRPQYQSNMAEIHHRGCAIECKTLHIVRILGEGGEEH